MEIKALQDSALFEFLLANPDWVAWSIALIAFAESFAVAGVVVPGVALLTVAAFVAGSGTLDMASTLAAAFVGAVLGDGSSYFIGKYYGQSLLTSRLMKKQQQWIVRGELFFSQHGTKGIVIGRFIGPIRPIMPLVAGMLKMPAGLFFMVNFASALAWAPIYMLPGFFLGASIELAIPPVVLAALITAAAALLLLLFYSLRHYFKVR
ncbi:MAG: DedA family protein [Pseudomonadales bacterium]